MSTSATRFIEPLDVLFLRGNQLFGDPGSFGESLVPPWPSVAAGALRSRMLADDRTDLAAFAKGEVEHPTLGTPASPGSFTLAGFQLARCIDGRTEILMPPPADLVIGHSKTNTLAVNRLIPTAVGFASSFPLPKLPVLAQAEREKPESGWWLTQSGWKTYLAGQTPTPQQLVHSRDLWSFDARVGIGMNTATRSVEDGKLFSAQAVAMRNGVGFLAEVTGAEPPADGLLRLGGDGRAAAVRAANATLPQADFTAIAQAGRCRLILTSPGIFQEGWKPGKTDADNRISIGGIKARLVCAAVPRFETVSGWDLARKAPKSARRAVPSGSVYWLEELEADAEVLRKLVANGLWEAICEDPSRRAEGFNRVAVAAW